jgi:hypothetical protein
VGAELARRALAEARAAGLRVHVDILPSNLAAVRFAQRRHVPLRLVDGVLERELRSSA